MTILQTQFIRRNTVHIALHLVNQTNIPTNQLPLRPPFRYYKGRSPDLTVIELKGKDVPSFPEWIDDDRSSEQTDRKSNSRLDPEVQFSIISLPA
jgi:hypothetical protein